MIRLSGQHEGEPHQRFATEPRRDTRRERGSTFHSNRARPELLRSLPGVGALHGRRHPAKRRREQRSLAPHEANRPARSRPRERADTEIRQPHLGRHRKLRQQRHPRAACHHLRDRRRLVARHSRPCAFVPAQNASACLPKQCSSSRTSMPTSQSSAGGLHRGRLGGDRGLDADPRSQNASQVSTKRTHRRAGSVRQLTSGIAARHRP
jgi:hypothetical protein